MPVIALVDDDRNILTSVSIALEAEGYRIMTYSDGVSALGGFKTSPPDLAILDIKMPRMDGLELLQRVRQTSEMPVILLTSKTRKSTSCSRSRSERTISSASVFPAVLLERVKVILRRTALKDGHKDNSGAKEQVPKVLERGRLLVDSERHTCTWMGKPVMLTVTEFLILQALATRPGVVKSRNALMDAAYHDDVHVDDRTIDSHIKRVRRKFLAVDDASDMIDTLYVASGTVFEKPDEIAPSR